MRTSRCNFLTRILPPAPQTKFLFTAKDGPSAGKCLTVDMTVQNGPTVENSDKSDEVVALAQQVATDTHNAMEASLAKLAATQRAAEICAALVSDHPSESLQEAVSSLQQKVEAFQLNAICSRNHAALAQRLAHAVQKKLAVLEQEFDQPFAHEHLRAQIAAQQENQRLPVLVSLLLAASNATQSPADESPGEADDAGRSSDEDPQFMESVQKFAEASLEDDHATHEGDDGPGEPPVAE